jgi:hypothetical protein
MNYNYYLLFINGLWKTSPIQHLIGPFTLAVTYHLPSPTTNTSTTTVIEKSDIPTLRFLLKALPTTFHTITKVHSIIANHQIVPLQRSLLVPKYTISIFLATTYKLFDPGGVLSFDLQVHAIMFSQTQSPCFSLPPDLRSEAWGVSVFPVFPRVTCVSPDSRTPYIIA